MQGDAGRKMVRWEVQKMRPHEQQARLFREPPPLEIAELAEDIGRNGLLQPVEILPDGTLLAGHKRVKAVQMLGWPQIDAWVREDLANDPAAAETRLIEDNLIRRQLGPLELARCYWRLKILGRSRRAGRLSDGENRELRDQIGERLGVSGRSLDRYLRIMNQAPPEVQNAVAAGQLGMTLAEKVAGWPKARQEEIAASIRDGADPRAVIRHHLQTTPTGPSSPWKCVDGLLRSLARAVVQMRGRPIASLRLTDADREILGQGERLIRRLRNGRRR